MKKRRQKIYIKFNNADKSISYSGIDFSEFVQFASIPMKNLLLIKGNHLGDRTEYNFELFEGEESIQRLSHEDIYNDGDFCFVDYKNSKNTSQLNKNQISELLYFGHMFETIHSPFFKCLNNRFAYLTHDDGWDCKLYCKNPLDFITIFFNKILAYTGNKAKVLPSELYKIILNLSTRGILIDLEQIERKIEAIEIYLRIIGLFSNMDIIQNTYDQIAKRSTEIYKIRLYKEAWEISPVILPNCP